MSNGKITKAQAELMKTAPMEERVDFLIDVVMELHENCRQRPRQCAEDRRGRHSRLRAVVAWGIGIAVSLMAIVSFVLTLTGQLGG